MVFFVNNGNCVPVILGEYDEKIGGLPVYPISTNQSGSCFYLEGKDFNRIFDTEEKAKVYLFKGLVVNILFKKRWKKHDYKIQIIY